MTEILKTHGGHWGHKDRWSKQELVQFYRFYPQFRRAGYHPRKEWTQLEIAVILSNMQVIDEASKYSQMMDADLANIPADIAVMIVLHVGGKALTMAGIAAEDAAIYGKQTIWTKPITLQSQASNGLQYTKIPSNPISPRLGVSNKVINHTDDLVTVNSRYLGKVEYNKSSIFNNSNIAYCKQNEVMVINTRTGSRLFKNPIFGEVLKGREANVINQLQRTKIVGHMKREPSNVVAFYSFEKNDITIRDFAYNKKYLLPSAEGEFGQYYGHELFHSLSNTKKVSLPYKNLEEGATEYLYTKFLNLETGQTIPIKSGYVEQCRVAQRINHALGRYSGSSDKGVKMFADIYFNNPKFLNGLDDYFGKGFSGYVEGQMKAGNYSQVKMYIDSFWAK